MGQFLVENAPGTNKKKAINPITITLPDGTAIRFTHTCNLDIPWLQHEMTEAHIVPGLTHLSLISTRKFCNAECQVVFNLYKCRVYFDNQLLLTGACVQLGAQCAGLWRLPINPKAAASAVNTIAQHDLETSPSQQAQHAASNVQKMLYLKNQIRYMHQNFFSQPKHTIIKVIDNNQFK